MNRDWSESCIDDWIRRPPRLSLVNKKRILGTACEPRNHLIAKMSMVTCDCFSSDRPPTIQGGVLQVLSNEDDDVRLDQADKNGILPNGEYATAKYMREIGYWSPPKYPRFKSPKRKKVAGSKKKRKRGKKLDMPPPKVFKEEPPVVNEQGEQTEVQVFEEFNPDEILSNLYNLPPPPPWCPRCNVPMSYGCIKAADGTDWYKYYRCPEVRFFTKCYVTCGADELSDYLPRVQSQTHPCYNDIDPARFRCLCNKSLVLSTSRSQKNPGRLYLKCQKRNCKFFQWIDEPPRGLAEDILIKSL